MQHPLPTTIPPTTARKGSAQRNNNRSHDNQPTRIKSLPTNPSPSTCPKNKPAPKMNPVAVWPCNIVVVLFHARAKWPTTRAEPRRIPVSSAKAELPTQAGVGSSATCRSLAISVLLFRRSCAGLQLTFSSPMRRSRIRCSVRFGNSKSQFLALLNQAQSNFQIC